eukprot:SAG25_NODE_8338_length_427_cov_0.551829_1_plen_52_part_10
MAYDRGGFYRAQILEVKQSRAVQGGELRSYYVHFDGWSSRYDGWRTYDQLRR